MKIKCKMQICEMQIVVWCKAKTSALGSDSPGYNNMCMLAMLIILLSQLGPGGPNSHFLVNAALVMLGTQKSIQHLIKY